MTIRISRLGAQYLTVMLLAVAALWVIARPSQSELSVPFIYAGDVLQAQMFIKGMTENGWYLRNPDLGAPGVGENYDFPMADALHLFVIKALSLALHGSGLLLNIYFLLTFPLTALLAFAVLRHKGIAFPVATLGALLYAFQPYHLIRGETHLFLAGYYLVPLVVLLMLWIAEGRGPFGASREERSTRGAAGAARIGSPYVWLSGLICVAVGIGGVYYAFFACFLLVVAGAVAALRWRSRRPILAAAALVLVIAASGLSNLAPSIVYWTKHGFNPTAVQRSPAHAEIFGLKLVQLVMPISTHRISAVAAAVQQYQRSAPLVNENTSASLGFVGSVAEGVSIVAERGEVLQDAIWYYPEPYPAVNAIAGRVAFYADRVTITDRS